MPVENPHDNASLGPFETLEGLKEALTAVSDSTSGVTTPEGRDETTKNGSVGTSNETAAMDGRVISEVGKEGLAKVGRNGAKKKKAKSKNRASVSVNRASTESFLRSPITGRAETASRHAAGDCGIYRRQQRLRNSLVFYTHVESHQTRDGIDVLRNGLCLECERSEEGTWDWWW